MSNEMDLDSHQWPSGEKLLSLLDELTESEQAELIEQLSFLGTRAEAGIAKVFAELSALAVEAQARKQLNQANPEIAALKRMFSKDEA